MKTSARFLAMLLAVVMVASAALSVSAFDDVAGNKHANAINVLAQLDVIGGYEDGTFKPDQKVTRAEMAKLSYVLYTTFVDAGKGATAFSDVAADNWAAGYIRWCSAQGIIGGYGDGKFGPNDNVTYDQALKMVCGVLGYNDWNSNLWPTDVRSKALRDLELGENLDDVKGGDQLTRAQVAQIMYNALNKPMNEKVMKDLPLYANGQIVTDGSGNPVTMPQEVAKTLQENVWKIEEVKYVVNSVSAKEVITLDKTIDGKNGFDLEDLGLEAYEGKAKALEGLHLLGLKKIGSEKLLGGLDVLGSVVDGVKVEYNKALDTITIDGVAYKANEDDRAKELFVGSASAFETLANDKGAYVIKDAVKNALDAAYMARAIDVDGDAVIDKLVIAPKTAVKVTNIGKTTDKIVTLKTLTNSTYSSPKAADISIAVEKDDILVVATLGDIVYAEKVTPVETYATKLNETAGKVTLAEGGEVKFNNLTVAGATAQDITAANLGKDNATGYYIYNGEIILAEGIKAASEYDFAILKDIVKNDDDTLNETTMKYETSYEATLIVKGEEIKVTLPAEGTAVVINAVDSTENGETDDLTAEEALTPYGSTKVDNVPTYKYALVAAYAENDKGETVITVINSQDAAFGENDYIVSGKLSYDAERALYTVGDKTKVVLDDESVIYYTYKKEATGNFDHVGNYDKDTITDKSFTGLNAKDIKGNAFLVYNTTSKTYTLLAAFVDGEIKGKVDGVITHEEDGTLVLYAPENSNVTLGEDGKNYYEYTFMDNEKIENAAPVVSTDKAVDEGATATTAGNFYAWDATNEKYVDVNDMNTFKYVTLDGMFQTSGYVLEYKIGDDAETASIDEDLVVWGLYVDEEGEKALDVYKTLSVAELEAMLDEVNAYNKELLEDDNDDNDGDVYTVNAILVRVEDEAVEGKFNIESIIVEIYEENEDEELVPVNSALFRI